MNKRRCSQLVFWVIAIVVASPGIGYAENLTGHWQLNIEETAKLQPKTKTKTTDQNTFAVGASVGGLPVLLPGGGGSAGGLRAPKIVNCESMFVEKDRETVSVKCDESIERKFTIGELHGREASWSDKRLKEKYSSTTRTVTHELRLIKDDRMRIRINVKPPRQRARKYVMIFDRVESDS